MSTHANMVKMTTATTGIGTITLGSAVSGYQSFASAYGANATVDVMISDGTAWEVARDCTYTHSGTTLTRGTLEASSTGSAISLSGSATVSVVATAGFGNNIENFLGAWGALSGENSITGTATAVIGRLNVCSGTSSSYTVTLPAVSGNSGKYIGFLMSGALTKLVTLDGNASETIDGALTRPMWARESALLYCDGSGWYKMAGKSIPMTCSMYKASNETVGATGVAKKNAVDTVKLDNTGLLADTTNYRINIQRTGIYVPDSAIWIDPSGIGGYTRLLTFMYINGSGTGVPQGDFGAYLATSYSITEVPFQSISLTAGDYVELYGAVTYSSGSPSYICAASGARTHLGLMEVTQW